MKKLLVVLMVSIFALVAFSNVPNPDRIMHVTFGDADTLDPHYAYDTSSNEILFNLYDGLIAYDGESIESFIPMLSTNVPSEDDGTIINDGKTYIFRIREGVKFHNGAILTAEDVAYTFKRGMVFSSPSGPAYMFISKFLGVNDATTLAEEKIGVAWADMMDSNGNAKPEYRQALIDFYYEVIDPAIEVKGNEVHMHLAKPSSSFLFIMCHAGGWASIMNKDWMASIGAWDGEADGWWKYYDPQKEDSPIFERAMGTGAYKLVAWDKALERFELERFDDYWRGPAPVKTVIRQGIDEWATSRTMLERGEADLLMERALYYDQVAGREDEGIRVISNLPELTVIALNLTWSIREDSRYIYSGRLDGEGVPPDFFLDRNVRLGFQYAVDYDAIINDILLGHGMRLATALPSPLLGYTDDLIMPKFDLQQAENYFRRAYRGRLWDTGFKIAVLYNVGNDIRQAVAEMVRDNLAAINPRFQVEVIGLQWPAYLDAHINKELPAYALGWLSDYPDPTNFLDVYYASYGYYGNAMGENYEIFANRPRAGLGGVSIDDFLTSAGQELDPVRRAQLYEQFQRDVDGEAIVIPLYQPSGMRFMRTWVHGFVFNPIRPGHYYWELEKK